MAGQSEVEGINNHGVRKNGSVSVVPSGVEMVPLGESIGRSHVGARGDLPDEIKVLKKEGPVSLPSGELARVLEIGQVLVIGEDRGGVRSSLQVLFPLNKGEDNSKELVVIDVVVTFSRREGLGKVSAGVKVSCLI